MTTLQPFDVACVFEVSEGFLFLGRLIAELSHCF